jgi:ABC-2 type transport system ATP-binding protein
MSATILEAIDLKKSYGAATALAGVSFQVAEGEMFGLLGPNGAGKTTLLSILACLMQPTAGEARILGRRTSTDDRALRAMLGIVPQELAIYGELTARENLAFFGSLYALSAPALEQRISEVLEAMGLTDRAGHRADTFSGGMKRRLNLGAALVHRPRLLLLDEPTTGVDPQSRNHIFEAIRRLNREGTTIVYTSHYMEEVQALCRRIGIIDHGRLAACDTLAGLLQRLDGLLRFQVPEVTSALCERLRALPGAELLSKDDHILELKCRDAKATLLRLVALLNELQIELVSLEMVEPNLERVFLKLTGGQLRD